MNVTESAIVVQGWMPGYGESWAVFSPDERHRYQLLRSWDSSLPYLVVIGLNPSTADAFSDDPTIRRCVGFAKRWGYGQLLMLNLFSYRSTNPGALASQYATVNLPRVIAALTCNTQTILNACETATHAGLGAVVAAWGTHGALYSAGDTLRAELEAVRVETACLGLTKDGHPKHPLYLPGNTRPIPFTLGGGVLCQDSQGSAATNTPGGFLCPPKTS